MFPNPGHDNTIGPYSGYQYESKSGQRTEIETVGRGSHAQHQQQSGRKRRSNGERESDTSTTEVQTSILRVTDSHKKSVDLLNVACLCESHYWYCHLSFDEKFHSNGIRKLNEFFQQHLPKMKK